MVVPLAIDAVTKKPVLVLKGGSTRAAHELRRPGQYVMTGMVGGRWDKKIGNDATAFAKKIGVAELAEEIGGTAVEGGAFTLGDTLVPTMPIASTEADLPIAAISTIDPAAITGDGSGMEVIGLMKPLAFSVEDAFALSRAGKVSEGARFEAYARRCLDKIAYVPELGMFVHQLPKALQDAFSHWGTLGLGEALDARKWIERATTSKPVSESKQQAPKVAVDTVKFIETKTVEFPGGVLFDATTDHAVLEDGKAVAVGQPHPNQLLHLDYDLAKVGVFYSDPLLGPMVEFRSYERPVLAAKDEGSALMRKDVSEIRVELPYPKSEDPGALIDSARNMEIDERAEAAVSSVFKDRGARVQRLGEPTFASPGQCDLQFHFYAAELESPPTDKSAFVPISYAIKMVRSGEGDAATEALLLRLCHELGWIPSLNLSTGLAKKMLRRP